MITALKKSTNLIYRIPFLGFQFRRFLESRLGERDYHTQGYWNESLNGWASSYLGGLLHHEMRDLTSILLMRRIAPNAKSVLDLGCAGATLAQCLGTEFKHYCGVDISDVAIANAKSRLDKTGIEINLEVSTLQDFTPARQYDVIVFNEVLYYLSLNDLSKVVRRYSDFLAPGGVILVSMKDNEICRLIQKVLQKELNLVQAVLYQQQPEAPGWQTVKNAKTPAFLIQAYHAT